MAREPEEYASKVKYCPGLGETICGSTNVMFKYLNNGKPDQPRYQCLDCKTWFTLGDHRRKKPGHYKKPRNKDPEELQGMRTECSWCGAVNQSRFKYYNNKNTTQPRFTCLGCEKLFQMRFDGKQLVPVKSKLRETKPAKTKPAKTKPGKRAPPNPTATTSANNDGCDGVVNEAQVGHFSNTQDQTLFGVPDQFVPMEQCDGGQRFNPEGVAQASASSYAFQYEYDHSGASAYESNGVVNVGQVGQFSNTKHQTFYGASNSVPTQQFDGGQYFFPQRMEASAGLHASAEECEYGASEYECNGVVNAAQVGQFSNTEHQTVYGASESVPMQQFDGGQYFCPQGMEACAGLYASAEEYENGASAYECIGVVNVGQADQFSNTENRTFYGASDCVPVEQFDGGPYFCPQGIEASASSYGSQTEYVHGTWASQCTSYDAVNAVKEPVLAGAAIPSDIPNYDTASACQYEEVNAEQVEQFSNVTDAVPVDQSNAGEYHYSQEMAAATAMASIFPNNDAMTYLEDFEEDLDAVSLWD